MFNHQSSIRGKNSWLNLSTRIALWLLLGGVFLFSLFNLAVYLIVPVDGAMVWVRQGPVKITYSPAAASVEMSLQAEDIILQIQGKPLDWWLAQRGRTLLTLFGRIGEPAPTTSITVRRENSVLNLTVPLSPRLRGITAGEFFTHMIAGYAFLIAGVFILRGGRNTTTERLTVLVMGLLALVEQNEILIALGAELAWSMMWLFIPLRLLTRWFAYSGSLHIGLLFPQPNSGLKRFPFLPWLIHAFNPLVTLAIMLSVGGNLQQRHAAAYSTSKNIYIVYLLLTALLLVRSYFTTTDVISKNQLRWIASGVAMAIIPNILLADLPVLVLGYRLLPPIISSILLLFIPVVVVIAMLRYHLWDIEVVIRASLLYGTLTVLLGLVYVGLATFLIGLLGATTLTPGEKNNPAVFFISALVVVVLFAPARNYAQQLIDRVFFRHKLDYPRLLTNLSRALFTSLLIEDLLILLNDAIPAQLGLRGGKVLLDSAPPAGSRELKVLKEGRIVWLQNVSGNQTHPPPPLDQLKQAGFWACVPLLSGDELLGIYSLGQKKSGEFYHRDEIALIETLARQAGVALRHAQLHTQLANQVRLQRDLEIAHQIQLSMLPLKDPQMPGLEIVSFSQPAQEVGGDFYHYFEYDSGRLGVAVGDVSGKGVPAALFMAVSISTLRAQAPHYAQNTAALLAAINNILYPQMLGSDVNTAMLYAILERLPSGSLIFSVSNAGLIWPILFRRGQKLEYVDVSGLPVGILPETSYDECKLELQPGDLLILCSDGIVEAMNDMQEMFGFEGLERALNHCDDIPTAAAVVKQIRQDLGAFASKTEPHDDMTIVAIRVL